MKPLNNVVKRWVTSIVELLIKLTCSDKGCVVERVHVGLLKIFPCIGIENNISSPYCYVSFPSKHFHG